MISPIRSQVTGLFVSALAGIAVGLATFEFLTQVWDFWKDFSGLLGTVLGIVLGGLTAFYLFEKRLRVVPLNWVGVGLFLGKPTGGIYQNGTQWAPPFCGILNVPGRTEKFSLEMKGEKIDAQDGIPIYFGIKEDGGRPNAIQYAVTDPTRYIATDDPEEGLREAYSEVARLFLGEAEEAVGVKHEGALFSDFIMLPPRKNPLPADYVAFEQRLTRAMFNSTQNGAPKRLYDDAAVRTVMTKAGEFRTKAETLWGIGNIVAFTPNIRLNPKLEQATTEQEVARAAAAAVKTRVDNVTDRAKDMRDKAGVSPDLAAVLAAGAAGQTVDIKHETKTYPGLADVIREVGMHAVDAFARKPQGGADVH